MSDITFLEIMEYYPEHNRSVYKDLKNACQHGCVIPFVGAGLSVFCGYQGWPDVLKQLANYVYDSGKSANIEAMIKSGELLQAAQKIQENYPLILKALRKEIDYDKIKSCDPNKLYASAAYALPYLFQGSPVITTNFDRVLEEVYDRLHKKFGKIITPYEPDLLAQSRQNNPHCLFKLHGDIGPDIHDIDRLIFTQTQYDRAYASDGPLMQELPQWFQSKKLLFLGCSLAKDKTMDVLQQVMSKNPGLDHYAILACAPEDISRRCIEMGKWGISAIYYPDERHEAVRVILERLLEEVNPSEYEELCRSATRSVSASPSVNRFMYDADFIAFIGRKQEFDQLQEFCQSAGQISWWAVVGPGGMGKSRLIYEFTNAKKAEGWKICWLEHSEYEKLSQWTPPVDRCIVVADDVQAYLQAIGSWIISISGRKRSEKLRIILLERDGKDLSSARWVELMQSEFPYDDTVSSKCYCSDFLHLEPLQDDELKAIMMDYAKASEKPLPHSEYADRLLRTLKKIDGDLQRPMYALAVADAWCSGQDPARWSKEQVLDALVVRELRFYYGRLRSLSTERISKEMRAELENLLAQSSVAPFLPLDQIANDKYARLRKLADKLDLSFPELLRQIGIVHNVQILIRDSESGNPVMQKDVMEAVVLDCPDLIKEYLVLRQSLNKNQWELLFPEDWDNDPMQLFFFRRILIDYPEKLEENKRFWAAFFAGDPKLEFCAWIYGDLLFGVTAQVPQMKKQAVERQEKLLNRFCDNEEIAVSYANGLVNLNWEQGLEDRAEGVDKLREFRERFSASEGVAEAYAYGLVNLTAKQALEDLAESVGKLRELREQFPASEEIALAYAKGLFNLTIKQGLEDRAESVGKLRELREQFLASEEIALAYANGLVKLTAKQGLEDRAESVGKLRELREQFPASEEIALAYAKGLVNLTWEQALKDCAESVGKLRELREQFPASEGAAVSYANGLVKLTVEQGLEDRAESVDKLQELREQFPASEVIAEVYANGLVNLSLWQTDKRDIMESVRQANKLRLKYPQNTEIQLSYAKTLFNLILKQESEDLHQTVAQLREFLLAYPEANQGFQDALDQYFNEHPDHMERYASLRI